MSHNTWREGGEARFRPPKRTLPFAAGSGCGRAPERGGSAARRPSASRHRKAVTGRPERAATGFTLLELMAAVAILTLLVAAALPVYRVVAAEYRLAGAAADLAAELEYARRLAVEQRGRTGGGGERYFGVTVLPDRFLLRAYDGPTSRDPPLRETPFPPGVEAAAFNGLTLPENGATVRFDARGLPRDETGQVSGGTFELRDARGHTSTVTISAAGKVAAE
jgi:prepilin-type N-terminal cleavage/methylation domain-containing protein